MTGLACRNLDVSIAGIRVTRSLELELEPGSFWGLLGPNGIGKTTLLKCLAGLNEPDAGEVLLGPEPLRRLSRRRIAQRIGMLQQHTVYLFDSSVLQIALTGRHPHLNRWDREGPDDIRMAGSALRGVDLDGFAGRSVISLSGGEARRLALAALLVQDPDVLLLDEPTNHLDLRHQLKIMGLIGGQVAEGGRCAVAALHDVNLAARYCSHVLMLFGGGEWEAGPGADMLTPERLERLYHCQVERIDTARGPRFYPLSA